MNIQVIDCEFSVCRLNREERLCLSGEFCFAARTDEELSLVCPTAQVPAHVLSREDGWRAFRFEGVLDFSLVGVLARVSAILADEQIGLFAVSTFCTDYILVKKENFEKALTLLLENGYTLTR